jgi:xylan 1,4-beta-xylosidase
MMFRNTLFSYFPLFLVWAFSAGAPLLAEAQSRTETIEIDAAAPGRPFPHYWERMFGSGRAVLSLRESYRRDLRDVKQITDFEYVRFHAIFHDELGVYDEDTAGKPIYNFSYVDQIYDGLLANGVRPFVELSFMPSKLAAASVLVQADRFSAKELCQVGRPDLALCATSCRPVWNR